MIGVILAGGRSRRMGVDKATVELAGRPLLDWVVDALAPVCVEVAVSGTDAPAGIRSLPDPAPAHRGPLVGLVAAQSAFPDSQVLLVAVDQPWIRGETVDRLESLAGDLAVVPVENGARQTTCAVYPPNLAGLAIEELKAGGSLQSLLDLASFLPLVDWRDWGEDGRSWFSADTPAALAEGLRRFGPPATS